MLTNYKRGVFWGEIDRMAELPAEPVTAWKDIVKIHESVGAMDDEFVRGYMDGHGGVVTHTGLSAVVET